MKKIFSILIFICSTVATFAQVELKLPFQKEVVFENDSVVRYWRKPPLETFSKIGESCILPSGALIQKDTTLNIGVLCLVVGGSGGVGGLCPIGTYFLLPQNEVDRLPKSDGTLQAGELSRRLKTKAAIEKRKKDKEPKKKAVLPNPALDSPVIIEDAQPVKPKKTKKSKKSTSKKG